MRLSNEQVLAIRSAIKDLGPDERVSSLKVNGKDVSLDEVMSAEVDAAGVDPKEPGRITRKANEIIDKLELKIDKFDAKLEGGGWRQKALVVLKSNPERVTRKATLELTLESGGTLRLPLDTIDRKATLKLEKMSRGAEMLAIMPLLGKLVPALTALGSGIASVTARARGDDALADATRKTANKHLVLTGLNFVPGLGEAACAMAAVNDHREVSRLRSVTAEEVTNLDAQPSD